MTDSTSAPTLTADEARDFDSKLGGFAGSLSENQRKYLSYAMHLVNQSDADVEGHNWNNWNNWNTWNW